MTKTIYTNLVCMCARACAMCVCIVVESNAPAWLRFSCVNRTQWQREHFHFSVVRRRQRSRRDKGKKMHWIKICGSLQEKGPNLWRFFFPPSTTPSPSPTLLYCYSLVTEMWQFTRIRKEKKRNEKKQWLDAHVAGYHIPIPTTCTVAYANHVSIFRYKIHT